MRLYEALAAEYKEIFPSSRDKLIFVEKLLGKKGPQTILDIGCASGDFAFQLSSSNRMIVGIDLDSLMIEQAEALLGSNSEKAIQFYQADMLTFLSESNTCQYDLISCMGNTAVYLNGEPELTDFLRSGKENLKDHGRMVIQILNYGNPEIVPGFAFPQVETGKIEFHREYVLGDSPSQLGFKTFIRDKSTGETDTDLHQHHRFLSMGIVEIAKEVGFHDAIVYGDYDGKEAEISDFFHLLVLRK